jgi:PKD repeat protein
VFLPDELLETIVSRSLFRTSSAYVLCLATGLALHACKPDTPTDPGSNRAPVASINSPSNASRWMAGESVSFEGSAVDPEDGVLSGAALRWASSIDGALGAGGSVSRDDLAEGLHTIRLIAVDSDGAADTAAVGIVIGTPSNQPPTATINLPESGQEFTIGQSISFQGTGSDPEDGPLTGSSLVWRSDRDGQIGTGIVFSRSDLSLGSHTIRLIATDADGAADTALASIGVGEPPNQVPTASFSFSCSNLTCTFTDGSADPDGTIESWVWEFGDGTGSTDQNPQHTYPAGGSYEVKLTVTDSDDATDDVVQQVSVTPQNQGPTASFTASCVLLTCTFTDASSDSDGIVESWAWTFGDGSGSELQNPQHTYTSGGPYTVTLVATDDDGATGQAVRQVTANAKPLADFAFECTGRTCQFSDQSTDPDGSITTRSWNFDDGTDSSQANPLHSFPDDGDYDVRLIVSDNGSPVARDTVTKTVTVLQPNQPPVASFTFSCTNLSCSFSDTSTDADGAVEAWAWDFGDGESSASRNPSHSYAEEGTYAVTLTVTDDDGDESAPATRTVSVSPANEGPTAEFTFVCLNLVCNFTDASSDPDGTIATRSWDFGDGTNSSLTNPQHAFAAKGDYQVSLEVTDDDGATGQTSQTVTVNSVPVVAILQPTNGASFDKGATVQFQGTATDGDNDALTLLWESSLDGSIGGGTSVTRSDLTVGTHEISFSGTDGAAADTARVTITIVNRPPQATITSPTNGAVFPLGAPVAFSGTGEDPDDGTLAGGSLQWESSLDGLIGTGTNFQRSDLLPGTHLIRLIANDSDGAADTASLSIRINRAPTATITEPPDGSAFTVGTNISFRGTGSDPEDGALTGGDIVWSSDLLGGDFGSGSPTNENGLPVGVHTITLTASDSDGATGADQITVTILATVNQSPTASFTTSCTALACTFTDASSDPDGSVVAWSWTFGDGNVSSEQSPQHTYAAGGLYTVDLQVTDDDGALSLPASQNVVLPAP